MGAGASASVPRLEDATPDFLAAYIGSLGPSYDAIGEAIQSNAIDGQVVADSMASKEELGELFSDLGMSNLQRRAVESRLRRWQQATPTSEPPTASVLESPAEAIGSFVSSSCNSVKALDTFLTEALHEAEGEERVAKSSVAGFAISEDAQKLIESAGKAVGAVAEAVAVAKPLLSLIQGIYSLYKDAKEVPAHAAEVKHFVQIVERAVCRAAQDDDPLTGEFLNKIREKIESLQKAVKTCLARSRTTKFLFASSDQREL